MRSKHHLFALFTLLCTSATAQAGVCDHVREVASATGSAAVTIATQAGMASAPIAAVTHSSGGMILTGASGYLAKTLGAFATAWAVATAPVTLAVTGGAVVVGAGVLAACLMSEETPTQATAQRSQVTD